MNPIVTSVVFNLWSFRKELSYVCLAFLIILILPILSVIVVTNTGIQMISDKLITLETKTHLIELHDPTGKIFTTLSEATSWPTRGTITLNFGESDLPYQLFHTGIDIAGKAGDPITPFMKGTVTYADEISWGYGKHIIIDNGNNITSLYAHLSEIYVKAGDTVNPGDIIGREGDTGWATGPHLHFEVRVYDIPVNPYSFL